MESKELEGLMDKALKEAQQAYDEDEVPVGSIVVLENKIIGRGHNTVEQDNDSTMHAEIKAIRQAQSQLSSWRLNNAYLFSTIEPCIMCVSAAILARIDTIVYGAPDPKFGGIKSITEIPSIRSLNHKINVIESVRSDEAAQLMQQFFRDLRNRRRGG